MPIEVEVPDLGTVEFPEGTSQDTILSSIQRHRTPQRASLPSGNNPGAVPDDYPAGMLTAVAEEPTGPGQPNPLSRLLSPIANKVTPQMAQNAIDLIANKTSGGMLGQPLEGPNTPPTTGAQIVAGVQNLATSTTSPLALASLGTGLLPGAAARAVSGGFLADTAYHLPETAQAAGQASVSGSLAEKIEGYGGLALAGLAGPAMGAHVAQSTPRGNAIRAISEVPDGPISGTRFETAAPIEARQRISKVEDLPPEQQTTLARPAPEELVSPAVKIGDRTFTAKSHPDALGEATKASLDDAALGDALTDFVIDPKPENQGFMVKDASGKERFASRAEAADIFEKATGKKSAKEGMLTSEDMRDAGLFEKPTETATVAQTPDAVRARHPETFDVPTYGQLPVEILRPDGSTYGGVFNGWMETIKPGTSKEDYLAGKGTVQVPSIGTRQEGSWSHGSLKAGEKLLSEVPTPEEFKAARAKNQFPDFEALAKEKAGLATLGTAEESVSPAPVESPSRAVAPPKESRPVAGELTLSQLPEAAQGAIVAAHRSDSPGIANSRWRPETVAIASLKPGNQMLWGDGNFRPRKSMTQGPIVVSVKNEIIDGNNRLYEAIQRGDQNIDIVREIQQPFRQTRIEHLEKFGIWQVQERFDPKTSIWETKNFTTEEDAKAYAAPKQTATTIPAEVASILDKLETVEQAGMISDVQQVQLNGLREALKGGWEAAKKWADGRLKEQQSRFSSNPFADPTYIIALGIRGAELIAGGVKKFGEWSGKMIGQFGEGIRPHLEDIYRESLINEGAIKKYPVETDEMKTRKSVESAIESEAIPDEVKGMLANDPASQYAVQRVAPKEGIESVSSLISRMTEADLSAVPIRSNIYVASKVELAKRLMREGRTDEGYNIFQNLAAEGTNFGQNIYQFTLLKSVDPTFVPRLINQQLVRAGYDPLTEPQTKVMADKSKASIDANDAAEAAKQKWLKDPTDANAEAVDAATAAAKEPALELQREMLKRQPKSLPQVLKAVVQGNLLTPISEVSNIAGNINFMPFRAAAEGVAASMDALDSFIRKRPREILFDPAGISAAGLRGAVQGLKEIPGILKRGQSDVMTGERFRGLQPMKAWKNLLTKAPDVPTIGGKVPLQDRLAMAVEGTFGMPAEVMLRGLAAGDAPFKAKAHAQAVDRQLNLAKVKAEDMAMARKYPELFMDEKGMQAIHEETLRSVFQQPSETITSLNRWIRNKGGDWGDFAATLIAPYRQTPWNLIGEIFSYNPLIGALKAAVEAKKGNIAGAERAAAKAAVGGVLTYAGWWLYKNGLLAPSLDDEDEQQKSRLLSGQILPPNHINLSGLERKMTGGSAAFRPGDTTVDTSKLGLAGAHFYTTANLGRDFEKKPRGATENAAAWLQNSIMEEARYGLNQSFLKGTSTALDAIRTGRTDEFVRGLENTLLSIPVPNTASAVSRATSPNKVVVKDDSKLKEFDNILQQRLRVFGLGKELPVSRGLWGEPLPETPEGSNPFAYHFLDITKNQQVTSDPAANEIYRLWRKTANTSVIPTPPNASLEFRRQNYVLTPEQQSQLQAAVGPVRKRITDDLVNSPNFQKLEDDSKIRILSRAYAAGLRVGKAQFLSEHGQELEAKGKKAGFTPE